MADNLMTIGGLIADRLDLSPAEVSDLLNAAPFVARLGAEESSNGTTHLYSKKTGAPVVGFRAANSGRAFSKSTDQLVTVSLQILDYSSAVDKAVADAWRKGGAPAFIARETLNHVTAAAFAYEQQCFYGTGQADAAGFVGMTDVLNATSHAMVVDGGGGTGDTGTSVFAMRLTPDDMTGVYKGDGPPSEFLGDTIVQDMVDGSGKHYPAYYTPGCSWLALQVGSAYSFGRLCNLNEGNPLDDDLLADLISAFPSAKQPTHFVMNRTSLGQLRNSRTATNATGTPAPFPAEAHNIPIIVTDAIVDTEDLVH
jgi:hypothetical protein